MTNEVAIEILEMLKIRPRRGSSMIIAQTAVNVALQTGINALYEKKDRIEKADNDLSSELEKNSKKLEKGNCENCIHNKGVLECDMYGCKYEPTTKNNLGVDCIDRAELLKAMDTWDKFGYTETGCFVRAPENDYVPYVRYGDMVKCVKRMPSVTPQEPRKGHWVLTDVEGDKVWHCNCSECGKDPQDYVGGSENWWLIKSKLPKFCPYCGSDNREVDNGNN